MRVLMAHNHYKEGGGEDESYRAEAALLESFGHEVIRYTLSNDRIGGRTAAVAGMRSVWSRESHRELGDLVRRHRPDVAHFQNIFPLISPSAYYAVKAEGVPVVQSLRNYRLSCLKATFFRDGQPCEDCVGKAVPWPGVVHACYRGSRPASTAVATMLVTHRALGTWSRMVDVYVALTAFARAKLQQTLPTSRMVVKPNFVYPDPGPGTGSGGYAVFVGRLAPEKGVDTMLTAWEGLGGRLPLRIVGDGPLGPAIRARAEGIPGVECLGRLPLNQTYDIIGEASLLVFPSRWYETFGRVAVEAFAKGTPVVAADIGAVAEVTRGTGAGVLYAPHDPSDLRRRVMELIEHPQELARMRTRARAHFETYYTGEVNYRQLIDIYRMAGAS